MESVNRSFLTHRLRNPWLRFGLGGLSGLFLFAVFPNSDLNLLVWVACLPLLLALAVESSLVRGFFVAYIAGAIFLAGSCYWFVLVMGHYGGLSRLISTAILALFVVVFSVFYGVFGLLEVWTARRWRAIALLLAPFLWVTAELARTYLITGFPWNLVGYAIGASGLRQLAAYTSVYGLSFLAVSTSALLAWISLDSRLGRKRLAPVAAWVGLLFAANWFLKPPPVDAGSRVACLIQPNMPMEESALREWAPWKDPEHLNHLVAISRDAVTGGATGSSPPLVIWPENPAPFYFNRDAVFRNALEKMARDTKAFVIVGTTIFAGQGTTSPKNSAVVLDPEGRDLVEYAKIHLVPFGEYVPAWAFPEKISKITYEVGDFVPGTSYEAARMPQGAIGIFICYEAIFPQLVRRLTPPGPGVLVNISDDGWFGDSSAAAQHLMMARFRAIENGRFLLRATNNGITAVIDPFGRVLDQIPRYREKVLTAHFDLVATRTFYSAHGDVFAWLSVGASVLIAGLARQRARHTNGSGE